MGSSPSEAKPQGFSPVDPTGNRGLELGIGAAKSLVLPAHDSSTTSIDEKPALGPGYTPGRAIAVGSWHDVVHVLEIRVNTGRFPELRCEAPPSSSGLPAPSSLRKIEFFLKQAARFDTARAASALQSLRKHLEVAESLGRAPMPFRGTRTYDLRDLPKADRDAILKNDLLRISAKAKEIGFTVKIIVSPAHRAAVEQTIRTTLAARPELMSNLVLAENDSVPAEIRRRLRDDLPYVNLEGLSADYIQRLVLSPELISRLERARELNAPVEFLTRTPAERRLMYTFFIRGPLQERPDLASWAIMQIPMEGGLGFSSVKFNPEMRPPHPSRPKQFQIYQPAEPKNELPPKAETFRPHQLDAARAVSTGGRREQFGPNQRLRELTTRFFKS